MKDLYAARKQCEWRDQSDPNQVFILNYLPVTIALKSKACNEYTIYIIALFHQEVSFSYFNLIRLEVR